MPDDTREPGAGEEVERAEEAAEADRAESVADAQIEESIDVDLDVISEAETGVDDDGVEISVDAGDVGDGEPMEPLLEPASINLSEDDILSVEAEIEADEAASARPTPPPAPSAGSGAPPMPPPNEAAAPDVAASGPPMPTTSPRDWEVEIPTALDRYLQEAAATTPESRAEALAAALEEAPKERKGELAYELGELQLSVLGDEARAVKAYGIALRSDPSLRANLWAIRRVFYRRGLWPNLIKLIGAELRFADSDRARADLEVEKGRIFEDKLAQSDEAKAAYSRAVAHDPTYLPALHALERRMLIEGDREGVAPVWRLLANAHQTPDIVLGYLLDLARAQVAAGSDEVSATLDEAAALDIEPERVARERMHAGRVTGDHEMMVAALEERVAAALANLGPAGLPDPTPRDPAEPPDPAEAIRLEIVACRRRQARILFDDLSDAERAWSALERALMAAPGNELVLADLADLAEAAGRFDDLAELVATWQAQEAEPERARALALRRVHALQRGGDNEAASQLLDQLAASYRGYVPIAAAREGVAMAAGDLGALGEIYAELGASAAAGTLFGEGGEADASAAAGYFCAAGAAAQLTGNTNGARASYARALEADGGSAAARDGLLSCLESLGDNDAVVAEIEQSGHDADADFAVRLARAALARGEVRRAADALAAARADLVADELLWLAALGLELGDASLESEALAAAAEKSTEPADAAELFGRAARVVELSEPAKAVELYRAALVQRGEDQLIRGCLLALLRRTQDWSALAQDLRDAASTGSDSRGSVAAWLELASVLEDRCDDASGAAEAFREALGLEPENAAALSGLIRVTRDGGDRRALEEALERAATSENPSTRLDASLELARIHMASGDLTLAAESAERAGEAERDAGLSTSVANLLAIEIAARSGDAEALARCLESAAERINATTAADYLTSAGWERAIAEDSAAAAALFSRAINLSPQNRAALLGSVVVADPSGASSDSLAHAEALAETLEGNTLAVSILRAAGVAAAVEGDEAAALRLLSRAVARAPDDLAAAIALTEVVSTGAEHAELSASAWARRAMAMAGGELRAARLEQAKALTRAGKLAAAGALALELVRSDRADPASAALLVEICVLGADVAGEASATFELSSRMVAPDAAAKHLRRAAQLYDAVLADPASASLAYRRLLELEPGAPERTRLMQLLAEQGDFGSLWDMYSDQIDLSQTDAERVTALQARAALRAALDDRVGAIRDLDRLLEIAPESAAATTLKSELEGELDAANRIVDGEAAAAAIIERSGSRNDHAARARDLVELASVYADVLGDAQRAEESLSAALSLDPTNLEAASAAGKLDDARVAIVSALEGSPGHRGGYEKLAAALGALGESAQSEMALEVARALSAAPSELGDEDISSLAATKRPFDPAVYDHLGASEASDEIASELWSRIADAISRSSDPSPSELGLKLGDRCSIRELGQRSPVAAALFERLRLRAEVYIVPDRVGWAIATSANRAMIYLSPDVADGATAAARFALGNVLTLSRERTGTLVQISTDQLLAYFSAARSLAGVEDAPLPGADSAAVATAIAELERSLPSRIAGSLAELKDGLAELGSVTAWRDRALTRARRFGLTVSGNIRDAAAAAAGEGRHLRDAPDALALLAYAASAEHLSLRAALGLGGGE